MVSFEQLRQSEKCNFYILTSASSFCLGSCGLLILYAHSTILPNSISHTGQVKSEPDAIYQREKQWRQGHEKRILTDKVGKLSYQYCHLWKPHYMQNSPFAIDKDVLILWRQGPQITSTLPYHQGSHQAHFNPKNMLTHSMGEFWASTQKALALMTVNTVGNYSILSLWHFFFSWGSDLTQ